MRVVIAELKQETNTFVPYLTTLAGFEAWHLYEGDEILEIARDTNWEVTGFVDMLSDAGIEIVPTIATMAMSGGKVEQATFDELLNRLIAAIEAAEPFDGICLALHGAMVTEQHDDGDGVIIDAVRDLIGPDIPMVVSMDLHGNLTQRCVDGADAIVGFRTSPHIDHRETGQRAARILVDTLNGKVTPVTRMVKVPMVTPASTHRHEVPGPFKRLVDASREAETGGVLAATVFAVQPWLDIEEFGFATVVVADRDAGLAAGTAASLATIAWNEREAFFALDLVDPDVAIARAMAQEDGPVILSDLADGNGAGSPGDATAVIAALLRSGPPRTSLCNVRDPEAARIAAESGVGAEVDLMVGGKLDSVYNQPVRVTGRVEFAGPAAFRFGGGGYTGMGMDMGTCAVIRHEELHLLITSNSCFFIDPEPYRAVGLEPADAQIVVVKSAIQFRSGFVGIERGIMLLDTPGMSSDHLEIFDFTRIPRPFYPFDPDIRFTVAP
ncbi:MAG TPA: M81 family metallopeptidase [Thermomicrobiales bacterium]|nr:M81 family metallopeptidase [Thermomicrobiales bacterium]